MSSFPSAHERSSLLEDARVVEALRAFWKSGSNIRTDSIWSNIDSAIQPGKSGWGNFSFGPLKILSNPALAGYASIAALVVITVIAGTLLYATQFDTARPPGAIASGQAFADSVPVGEQPVIPGYAAAITHYRESLISDEIVAFDGASDVVGPVVTGLPVTSPGANPPGIVSKSQPVNPIESEELIASIGPLGTEQSDQITPAFGNIEPESESPRINSEIVAVTTSVAGSGSAGNLPASEHNGVSQTAAFSASSGGGIPESNGSSGAVTETDEATPTGVGDVPINDAVIVDDGGTDESGFTDEAGEIAQAHEADDSPDAEAGFAYEGPTDAFAGDETAVDEPTSPAHDDDPIVDVGAEGIDFITEDEVFEQEHEADGSPDTSVGFTGEEPANDGVDGNPVVEDPASPEPVDDPAPDELEPGSGQPESDDGHGSEGRGKSKSDSSEPETGSEEAELADASLDDEPVVEEPISPELEDDPAPTKSERGSEQSNSGDGHDEKATSKKKNDSSGHEAYSSEEEPDEDTINDESNTEESKSPEPEDDSAPGDSKPEPEKSSHGSGHGDKSTGKKKDDSSDTESNPAIEEPEDEKSSDDEAEIDGESSDEVTEDESTTDDGDAGHGKGKTRGRGDRDDEVDKGTRHGK